MTWLMTKSFDEMMLGGASPQKSLYFVKTMNNHLIFREVVEGIRATNSETLVQIEDNNIIDFLANQGNLTAPHKGSLLLPLMSFSSLQHYLPALDLDFSYEGRIITSHEVLWKLSETLHIIGIAY